MTKSEQIELLYQAYPRHVGKGAAKRAIERALRKVPFDELMDAVVEYAECRRMPGQDSRFTPHPSTWFNQERWDDDRAEWRRPDGGQAPKMTAEDVQDRIDAIRRRRTG